MGLATRIKSDFAASYRSMKLPEIEEVFDIYVSRYFGYYVAVISKKLNLTPNQVSFASLGIGIFAGILFFFQDQFWLILAACFLLTFAGILDSADGQLARMTGTVSDLGRKIDVIIDTFVFVACYIGGGFYFWIYGDYGFFEILTIGVLAGYLHSVKSAVYEFYKTEFLYYHFRTPDYRIPYLEEVKPVSMNGGFWQKILFALEKDYIGKQAFYTGRKRETRKLFESISQSAQGEEFRKIYSNLSHRILTFWALVGGTNVHRTALMACSLFGRMDLYFMLTIATFPLVLILNFVQSRLDKKMLEAAKDLQS